MDAEHTVYALARLADCEDPENDQTPGADFLRSVESSTREAWDYGVTDASDTVHEIANGAVPIYTHHRWEVFVDLAAYQEDPVGEGLCDGRDMEQAAGVALYMIAERLAQALLDEYGDADDDDGGHGHIWGPWEHSRLAGTSHRKCTVPGCRFISLDNDDDDDDENDEAREHVARVAEEREARTEANFRKIGYVQDAEGRWVPADDDDETDQ